MDEQTDGSGNTYINVCNIRITTVPETWSGEPGIRIQAYKKNRQLFPGAELPVPDKATAFDLITAISQALGPVIESSSSSSAV